MFGSAGVQPQEQPIVVGKGLCVVIALIIAVSVDPMYITRLASPGAMPSAWVISSVCSVSSQSRRPRIHARRAGPVGGEQGYRHFVRLTDVVEIRCQVGQIGTVILKQSEVLASAG